MRTSVGAGLVVGAVLVLGGCGGGSGATQASPPVLITSASPSGSATDYLPATPSGPASAPAAPTPSGSVPPPGSAPSGSVPPVAGPLVVFSRTGGIAGRQATLTVQPDGRAALVGARQADWTLSPGQLDGLQRALAGADLRPVAPTGEPVLDGYSYRVTYAGRTVLLSGDPVPPGAASLVEKLSTLAEGPA